jgi:hypothetical protein
MATAFMLTGPLYDRGGSIPGIVLTLATIALATAGRGIATGVALAALLFTKLIYAPIALAFVLVHAIARSPARTGRRVPVAMRIGLRGRFRHRAHSPGRAENCTAIWQPSRQTCSIRTATSFSRRRCLATCGIMRSPRCTSARPFSLSLATFLFLLVRFLRGPADGALRPFLAGCLAIYPCRSR